MNKMVMDAKNLDTESCVSTSTLPVNTPPTTATATEYLWSGPGAVPWPDNIFQIVEKYTGRAITIAGDQIKLQPLGSASPPDTHWLCVKQDGYFGFQNPRTGRYLGHDGKGGIHALTSHLKAWELWTPRQHPEGGYEILSPHYWNALMVMCVHDDGSNLVRRQHGTTLWEFVQV